MDNRAFHTYRLKRVWWEISVPTLTLLGLFMWNVQIAGAAKKRPELKLEMLNPNAIITARDPDSFIPDENLEALPGRAKKWSEKIFIEDRKGVLKSIKLNIKNWENIDQYNRLWNLKSTGIHRTPSGSYRKKYLSKALLKYADKRLAGEIKNAKDGSTLKNIGKAQKALRPKVKARISKNVNVKFKARILEGKVSAVVDNPYINWKTEFKLSGKAEMHLQRKIKSIGVNTEVDYKLNDGVWIVRVNRPLTKNINARISSTQNNKNVAFSKNANKKIELRFKRNF